MSALSCDVVVVGSGAGGATAALALARRGARVLVVEKGPFYSIADFDRDELAVCRRNFFVPFVSDEPNLMIRGPGSPPQRTNDGWTACCVGGGTVHMSGFFYRMHEEDFRLRSLCGPIEGAEMVDWPIGMAELEPYYDRIEALLGVSGQAGENPFDLPRRGPYPLPPLIDHPLAERFDAVARGLGWHPFHTPRAVLSGPYDGRPRCTYSGFCGSYGCETTAKSSALSAVLPKAIATGRCTVLAGHMVREIRVDPQGRASGVVAVDAEGQARAIQARAVVVAGGAIQSARLLLNSRSGRFPKGLANNGDQVGRHLFFSTFSHVEAELLYAGAGARIPELRDPLPWLGRTVQDFYTYRHAGQLYKGGTIRFDFVHPNPIYNAEVVAKRGGLKWGAELKRAIKRRLAEGRTLEAEIFAEYLPVAGTRVEVDEKVRDRWGVPVALVHLEHHPRNLEVAGFLADRAAEAFTALGADDVHVETRAGTTYVLQGGSCRMGTDPAASVVDPSCRTHEVDNLYLADGSVLPSSGGIPITLTIHANALRVGTALAERLSRREL